MKRPRLKRPRAEVIAQGNLLKLSVGSAFPVKGGGPRGVVHGFSRQSRKRMLELIARLHFPSAGFCAFATLTFPDGDGPPTAAEASRDLQTFLKRMRRRFPDTAIIWRREWEPRKSGDFVGAEFPHFHLLCLSIPFFPHQDLNSVWRSVIDADGYVRTEIEAVRSWFQVLGYVSKYMAKPEKTPAGAQAGLGRRGAPASCSLVYGTYLTGNGEEEKQEAETSKGRAWGVHNRKKLPFAESQSVSLKPGPWLEEAKLWAAEIWPQVKDNYGNSFTLFTEEPYEGLQLLQELSRVVIPSESE